MVVLVTILAGIFMIDVSYWYPVLTEDDFVSFRITQNLLLYGQPYFHPGQSINISSSLIYPFWNVFWAWLGKEDWMEWVPLIHAVLFSAAFGVICLRMRFWFPGSGMIPMLGGFSAAFLAFLHFAESDFGGQGPESSLLILGLSMVLLPGQSMARRFPVFTWWLFLVHPEGLLAGTARIFQAWWINRNFEGIKTSLFWAFWACMIWGLASVVFYDSIFPQSWAIQFLFPVQWLAEVQKVLVEKLFFQYPETLVLGLLAIWLRPQVLQMVAGPVCFLILKVFIFSFLPGGSPGNVSTEIVPMAWISGISVLSLMEWVQAQLSVRFKPFLLSCLLAGIPVFGVIWTSKPWVEKVRLSSEKCRKTRITQENLANFLNRQVYPDNIILTSSVGLVGWYAPFHHFLDYPGLTSSSMSDFLKSKKRYIPSQLTDVEMDSAIIRKFEPDVILANREEKMQLEKLNIFSDAYWQIHQIPNLASDSQMDSIWVFQTLKRPPVE